MFWQSNELVLLLATLAGFLAATEAGFRLGRRNAGGDDPTARQFSDLLLSAVLGLLALLLGFTFYMATARFDARKALVLEEANAIGTAYLRSQFLPAEQRSAARDLFRAHVSARMAFHAAGIDGARLEKAEGDAARTEGQLWTLAREAASQDPRSLPASLFVESMNAVIDVHEKRRAAFDNHVPEAVITLLVGIAAVALAVLGHGCGLVQRRRLGSSAILAALIVFVLTAILDIDRPRRGLITVSQESMVRLQATLEREGR